jgi:hypothetical protein
MCLDFNCFVAVRYFYAYYSTGTSLHSYVLSSEKLADSWAWIYTFTYFLTFPLC